MEIVEEQLTRFHEEVTAMKADLQHLGPLEVKVDSMQEKLSILDRLEQILQR